MDIYTLKKWHEQFGNFLEPEPFIKFIGEWLEPQTVFSEETLKQWALDEGWTMDKSEEYEKEITKNIAETCHLTLMVSGNYYSCNLCGKRFYLYYIGRNINDRMLEHYAVHQRKGKY